MFGCSVMTWTNRHVILGQFLTFYPLTGLTIKNKKKIKKPENAREIVISHQCTKNYMFGCRVMALDKHGLFWVNFCPFTT